MLWSNDQIHTPGGKRLHLRYLALYQPNFAKGILRARLSEHQFGPDSTMFLCSRNGRGQWIATRTAPSIQSEAFHPDLEESENEYILVAREVLAALGPGNAAIQVVLDTHQNADYRQDRIAHVLFSREGISDERALNLIPGVRALEQSADLFWDTFATDHWPDGGTQGEFEFLIKSDEMQISFEDPTENKITLKSELRNGSWHHSTELLLCGQEQPNIIDEMKQFRDGPAHILAERFPSSMFASAFENASIASEAILSHEINANGSHSFSLRPGALQGFTSH